MLDCPIRESVTKIAKKFLDGVNTFGTDDVLLTKNENRFMMLG